MKDMTNGRFFLTPKTYRAFLAFWQEHFDDLAEAVLVIAYQCQDVWFKPEEQPLVGMPEVDLGKLRRFLETAVGKEVMDKLLIQPEEAVADKELCREAAFKLWKIADALPPRDLGTIIGETRGNPMFADFWERRDRDLAERNARLAPPPQPA